MTDFDKFRRELAERHRRFERWFWMWFAFCAVLGLSTLGGVLYVALHFILKWW